jgi:hypothetical protein
VDTLYAATLLVSFAGGALAVASSISALVARSGRARNRCARLGGGALACGAAAGIVSFLVHGRWGHGQESVEPMALGVFLSAHPAYAAAAALLLAGFVAWRRVAARVRENVRSRDAA